MGYYRYSRFFLLKNNGISVSSVGSLFKLTNRSGVQIVHRLYGLNLFNEQ